MSTTERDHADGHVKKETQQKTTFGKWSLWSINERLAAYTLGFNMDIPRVMHTMFQELALLTLIGVVATMMDFCFLYLPRTERVNEYDKRFPSVFLFTLLLTKVFEPLIFEGICSCLKLPYHETCSSYGIFQNLAILISISIANWIPFYNGMFPSYYFGPDYRVLCDKVIGTCAMVAFARLYMSGIIFALCNYCGLDGWSSFEKVLHRQGNNNNIINK